MKLKIINKTVPIKIYSDGSAVGFVKAVRRFSWMGQELLITEAYFMPKYRVITHATSGTMVIGHLPYRKTINGAARQLEILVKLHGKKKVLDRMKKKKPMAKKYLKEAEKLDALQALKEKEK